MFEEMNKGPTEFCQTDIKKIAVKEIAWHFGISVS